MRHSDPPRRPRPLGRGRAPLQATRAPRRLIRANRLMNEGRFREAAESFVRLSKGARRRGMPIRAANLAARASQAYLAQDQAKPAVDQVRVAVRILVHRGQSQRAARLTARAVQALSDKGFHAQAEQLKALADRLRREKGISDSDWETSPPTESAAARGDLPSSCSGCGAPLIAGDVTWHDPQTAECPYCGAVIKAT